MNTALKFCYEVQGFAEITNEDPTKAQWLIILKKLEDVSVDDLIIDTDVFMAAEMFVVWLKGFVEVAEPTNITTQQWQIIKDHLQLVFTKVTPSYEDEDDETETAKRVHELFEGMKNNPRPFETLDKLDLICACENTNDRAYCGTNQDQEEFQGQEIPGR